MGRYPTKAKGNPWCDARIKAAEYDDRLYSREFAAELLGLSYSQLSDYELSKTKVVPVESVMHMADLYNAPELRNYYCRKLCPIGCDFPEVKEEGLDRATIKALSVIEKIEWVRCRLIEIARDGRITDDEWTDFETILQVLEQFEAVSQEFKQFALKQKGGRGYAGDGSRGQGTDAKQADKS